MNLADVINNIKEGEVYESTFAINEHWYITKSVGFIRYCSKDGDLHYDAIMLTPSNLRADYELV